MVDDFINRRYTFIGNFLIGGNMGKIQKAYFMPHPVSIIPEVGKGQESATIKTSNACDYIAQQVCKFLPDNIILISSHGTAYEDFIHISQGKTLKGSFGAFGVEELSYEFNTDIELVDRIIQIAKYHGIESGGPSVRNDELDYGALVPLYFITKYYRDFKLTRVSIAGLPLERLYLFGYCIQNVAYQMNKKIIVIASGNLSHKLNNSPHGYSKVGEEFDEKVNQIVEEANFKMLIEMDESFCDAAQECGIRSMAILAGTLNGFGVNSKILSYEKPYGVGYLTAELNLDKEDSTRDLVSFYNSKQKQEIKDVRKAESIYVKLARQSLEYFVKHRKILELPENLPEKNINNRAAVYVSIMKWGQLRGCMGTITPTHENLGKEIIHDAIDAGIYDPLFNPVQEHELENLVYYVDILGEPEEIKGIEELNLSRYGVIVSIGNRVALVLPKMIGINTIEKQVELALLRAGIQKNEKYLLERIEVRHYK